MQEFDPRLAKITHGVMMHAFKRLFMDVSHWKVITRPAIYGKVDGVLVTVHEKKYQDIYLCGRFECGCCRKMQKMSEEEIPKFHMYESVVLCTTCAATAPEEMMYDMHVQVDEVIIHSMYRIEVVEDNIELPDVNVMGQLIAENNNFVFINNKNTSDLRCDFLAKRVLRRLRDRVNKRRKKMMFQILYENGIGLDASIELAKRFMPELVVKCV